MAILSFEMNT